MSAIARNSAIEPVKNGGIAHVDTDTLRQLLGWVENIASPEELAWNSDRFKEVRDWLKQHKAAKQMRIEAVRIECISLRKVAMAGLSAKLKSHQERNAAEYFAGLSDEEFDDLLKESEATTSPVTVMNSRIKDEKPLNAWFRSRRESPDGLTATEAGELLDEYGHDRNLATAVQKILDRVAVESETFTVREAADQLYAELAEKVAATNRSRSVDHDDNWEGESLVPPEIAGEPLREVVRRVLRTPGPADRAEIDGVRVVIPRYVTYLPGGEGLAVRIPWEKADVSQLLQMVIAREKQAQELQAAAANLRHLYEFLAKESTEDVDRVVDLIQFSGLRKSEARAAA